MTIMSRFKMLKRTSPRQNHVTRHAQERSAKNIVNYLVQHNCTRLALKNTPEKPIEPSPTDSQT